MRPEKAFEQFEKKFEHNIKKRFACSNCGKTWVEIVGLFAGNIDGKKETFLQLGQESEACQKCKFRIRSCPTCGAKNAYEIHFPTTNSNNSQLSFDRIRIVSN